jgi:hypothetical protein
VLASVIIAIHGASARADTPVGPYNGTIIVYQCAHIGMPL